MSATLALPLAAQAQNIAIVNGKAVPKARGRRARSAQVAQAGRQPASNAARPRASQVRDKVVTDEIFMQEAEKRGLAASADYKRRWSSRARAS